MLHDRIHSWSIYRTEEVIMVSRAEELIEEKYMNMTDEELDYEARNASMKAALALYVIVRRLEQRVQYLESKLQAHVEDYEGGPIIGM